jgi:hypothetical protein
MQPHQPTFEQARMRNTVEVVAVHQTNGKQAEYENNPERRYDWRKQGTCERVGEELHATR